MQDADHVRRELQAAGRYMKEHGLAWGNAGNISARTEQSRYLITASGTFPGVLEAADHVRRER